MKTLDEIRETISAHRDVLAQKYGVTAIGLFGSYARREEKAQSDLDVLIEILRPINLLELVGAEIYLSEVLGVR